MAGEEGTQQQKSGTSTRANASPSLTDNHEQAWRRLWGFSHGAASPEVTPMTDDDTTKTRPTDAPKRRGTHGRKGSVYKVKGCANWIISYRGLDGRRHTESSKTPLKGKAIDLLDERIGAIKNGLNVTPASVRVTFE